MIFVLTSTAHANVHWGTISNGKFYQVSPAPDGYVDQYPNDFTSGTKLTDEVRGASWPLDGWIGWLAKPVTIVLDLGSSYAVSDAHLGLASIRAWGVGFPTSVAISTSIDGASWTPYGTSTVPSDPADQSWATATATASGWVNARYVRFVIPATSYLTFVDEIWVNGSVVDSAKHVPSTFYQGAFPVESHGWLDIGSFEADTACPLDMVLWYANWTTPFEGGNSDPGDLISRLIGGRFLEVGFLPEHATAAQIAQGQYDGFLRSWFAALGRRSVPVWVRPMNEMNGCWTGPLPYGSGSGPTANCNASSPLHYGRDPANYRRAWRRMYNIAEQVGATGPDQIFVWAPGSSPDAGNPQDPNDPDRISSYYPGPQYVDWVGVSAYSSDATSLDSLVQGIDSQYGNDKPLMIAEGGNSDTTPSRRAAWIDGWFATLRGGRPHIKAAVWFSSTQPDPTTGAPNLSALRQANDPGKLALSAYARGCRAH
ncbi:MAG TPA: discoidin domain-containing protein [Kofleriaceae bacterium]